MKRHGFCRPLHWTQVGSWLFVVLLASEFFVFTAPNLHGVYRQSCLGTYIATLSLTTLLCYCCTKTDPTDEAVKLAHRGSRPSQPKRFPRLCVRCATHVETRSKHCSQCDRCTADFDHHCNWLNNCVGRGNYRGFVLLICSLEMCMCVQTVATASVFTDTLEHEELRDRYDVGDFATLFMVVLLLATLLAGGIALANGGLILFHCYLGWEHLSTYEFVLARREKHKVSPAYSETPCNLTALQRSSEAMEQIMLSKLAEGIPKHASNDQTPQSMESLQLPSLKEVFPARTN